MLMPEYYWNIDCQNCGHVWQVEVQEGCHSEECPQCGSTLVMDGEDVLYQVTERKP